MSALIESLDKTKKFIIDSPPLSSEYSCKWLLDNFAPNGRIDENLCFDIGGLVLINQVPVESVIWVENHVSVYKLQKNLDIVSFNFDGCVMAYFEMSYGQKYAAHIHMPTCKIAWNKYIEPFRNQISKLIMFRPDFNKRRHIMKINRNQYDDIQLIGIIDTYLNCYSVCIGLLSNKQYNKEWEVVFIEKHITPFYVQNYLKILEIQDNIDTVWENFWQSQTIREYDLKTCIVI